MCEEPALPATRGWAGKPARIFIDGGPLVGYV